MADYKPTFSGLSPQQAKSKRSVSQALLGEGMDTSPVGHWTQALARVVQGGIGGYQQGAADRGEAEGRRDVNARLTKALTSKAPLSETATSLMGNPWSEEAGQDLAVSSMKQDARLAADDPRREYTQRAQVAEEQGLQRGTAEWKSFVLTGKLPNADGGALDAARLDLIRAQTEAARAKSNTGNVDADRTADLVRMSIDPESAEGKAYRLNGKLPAAGYTQMNQIQLRERAAPKISEGLKNLNNMTETYDDASFDNAVGPFQGSTPSSLFGAIPINIGRLFGEAANTVEGGNTSPSEVRSNIQGTTEALAAAIKPLIRAPGEGVWTDADQERLVAVVGDLAQSRDKTEFKRRLNAVRDRIKSNFALDVQFDALPGATGDAPVSEAAPSGQSVPQVTSEAEYNALPSGATYTDPNGKVRRKK
jgi:hypothetical protein